MSYIKQKKEIKRIEEGGKILGDVLERLQHMVAPGVSMFDIDEEAERLIRDAGGIPAFKGYKIPGHTPFPGTICASLNNEVVHGIPTKEKILKDGDNIGIDIGMQWPANSKEGKGGNGFFTDTAITVCVGQCEQKLLDLNERTQQALYRGIEACVLGNSIASIGKAVESYVKPFKYGIVEDLVGHGVGHDVHEDPYVPNYYSKELESWDLLHGAVLALEPMLTLGGKRVKTAANGWSIVTADGSTSAHFEHTVIITEDGPIIATKRPSETM